MEIARSFRDLRTYKLARESARSIFQITRNFPAEERYSLTDQIRRSSRAVNAMIAVVTLAVTIVADVILIPLLDVTGAAIGASLAYVVSLTLTALAYRRLSGASILDALLPRPSDAGIALDAARGAIARFASR